MLYKEKCTFTNTHTHTHTHCYTHTHTVWFNECDAWKNMKYNKHSSLHNWWVFLHLHHHIRAVSCHWEECVCVCVCLCVCIPLSIILCLACMSNCQCVCCFCAFSTHAFSFLLAFVCDCLTVRKYVCVRVCVHTWVSVKA